MKNKQINDIVFMNSSIVKQNIGPKKIIDIDYKYDVNTGEKFIIYLVDSDSKVYANVWFDGRNGKCFTNPSCVYFIEL